MVGFSVFNLCVFTLLTLEHLYSQVYRWPHDILVPLSFISFTLTFFSHLQPFCLPFFDCSFHPPLLLLRVSFLFVSPQLSASNLTLSEKKKNQPFLHPVLPSPLLQFSFCFYISLSLLWVTPRIQLNTIIFFCVQSHFLWMRDITGKGFERVRGEKEL